MKKIICAFLPVIWGLILCTFLSLWIEEQMTAKAVVIQGKNGETLELPLSSLVTDEAGTHLYMAADKIFRFYQHHK